MTESPEVMRQQIEETKSQLWEKLDTLECQVSEVVQSTSTAVSETVASVQETVSNVTDTVQESVQSVSNAFDLPLQVERHPWLAVGGSFVLGYLTCELLNAPPKEFEDDPRTESRPSFSSVPSQNGDGHHAIERAQEASSKSLVWAEMRGMLTGALMGAVSTMISRGVPVALDYLANNFHSDLHSDQDTVEEWEKRRSPK